jgi:hypothetical protein
VVWAYMGVVFVGQQQVHPSRNAAATICLHAARLFSLWQATRCWRLVTVHALCNFVALEHTS